MNHEPESQSPPGNWLEKRLATLDAIYHRFGIQGMKDQPIAEVGLLLSAKELQFRDAAKGRDLSEEAKAANRQLELEIKDLSGCVRAQFASLSLSDLRSHRHADRPPPRDHQQQQPRRDRDHDRER